MTTLVTELTVGDRFLHLDDVMVTIIQTAEPWNEPFGRPGFVRLEGRRNDTGAVGWVPFGPDAEVITVKCVPGCTGHPDLPPGWTSWQEILHSDLSGKALETWKTTEPAARAATLGHVVESVDTVERSEARLPDDMQCRRRGCEAVVVIYGTNIYGSAVERRCEASSS